MPALDLKMACLGGSRGRARKLMLDLALCAHLTGQVAVYDIDLAMTTLARAPELALQAVPGAWARFNQMQQASRTFLPGWKID